MLRARNLTRLAKQATKLAQTKLSGSTPSKLMPRWLSTQIHLGHFTEKKYQFGPEATIALEEVRQFSNISRSDLTHYLHYTVKAIDPTILANSQFLTKTSQILTEVLGNQDRYSVQEHLEKLRKIENPTVQQKLVMRTLSLISFDLLDPLDVEKQQVQRLYEDLHILDMQILPEPRRGGANGFRSLKVYQDGERRIRFHIYPSGSPENNLIAQDNLAHQHYGSSASIILAGNLVNQHYVATPTNNPDTELALYRVAPEFDPTRDADKAVRSAKTLTYHQGVNMTLVSSHLYKAGEYYHLPKPISDTEEKKYPYKLTVSDRLDYHKVGNLGLTATFWSLKYPKHEMEYDFSVLPRTSPKKLSIDYSKKNLDMKAFYPLLVETDKLIRKDLASTQNISTMLDRGARGLFQERAKIYSQNKVMPITSAPVLKAMPTAQNALTLFRAPQTDDKSTQSAAILAVNIGSSSIKFSLFAVEDKNNQPKNFIEGQVDITSDGYKIIIKDLDKNKILLQEKVTFELTQQNIYDIALKKIFEWIANNLSNLKLEAICHRVLHGADRFQDHVRINPENIKKIEELIPIAPMHQPFNVAGIKSAYAYYPDIPQYACFDTTFHVMQSEIQRAVPIAPQTTPITLQNYGFHGLSYEYIVSQLQQHLGQAKANGKIIIAHLGGGSTLCAVEKGKSVAATGGFSKLDGVMMGTRSGSVDPGILLYLLNFMPKEKLQQLLFYNSGLKGVSQHSQDTRVLFKRDEDPDSIKALELYVQSLAENIAKMATKLGGVDAIVFTGGIGETSVKVREQVCEKLKFLGVQLNNKDNLTNNTTISDNASKVSVLVIPTNENLQMVKHAVRLLRKEKEPKAALQARP